MFENMTQEQAREAVFETVRAYYEKYMRVPAYKAGGRINYSGRVFDEMEIVKLVDSALDFWLTAGKYTDEFEKKFAAYLGLPFCSLVNSGSSANLLAVAAPMKEAVYGKQL